jgi:hypothetical protein
VGAACKRSDFHKCAHHRESNKKAARQTRQGRGRRAQIRGWKSRHYARLFVWCVRIWVIGLQKGMRADEGVPTAAAALHIWSQRMWWRTCHLRVKWQGKYRPKTDRPSMCSESVCVWLSSHYGKRAYQRIIGCFLDNYTRSWRARGGAQGGISRRPCRRRGKITLSANMLSALRELGN